GLVREGGSNDALRREAHRMPRPLPVGLASSRLDPPDSIGNTRHHAPEGGPGLGGLKVTSWISRIGVASSPTRKVRWPTPRTGVPSPPRQSVARPSRSRSSGSADDPA